jgi:hypothetical protein
VQQHLQYPPNIVLSVAAAAAAVQVAGVKYASYRTMARFNSTNTTNVRDMMFGGVSTATAKPCAGGYNTTLYKNVATLFAKGPFKVSQNSE